MKYGDWTAHFHPGGNVCTRPVKYDIFLTHSNYPDTCGLKVSLFLRENVSLVQIAGFTFPYFYLKLYDLLVLHEGKPGELFLNYSDSEVWVCWFVSLIFFPLRIPASSSSLLWRKCVFHGIVHALWESHLLTLSRCGEHPHAELGFNLHSASGSFPWSPLVE